MRSPAPIRNASACQPALHALTGQPGVEMVLVRHQRPAAIRLSAKLGEVFVIGIQRAIFGHKKSGVDPVDPGMMDHPIVGGLEFDRLHPDLLGKYMVAVQQNLLVGVVPLRGVLRKFEHQVRCPQHPLLPGPRRPRRRVLEVPTRGVRVDPAGDQVNLRFRKAVVILKISERRVRMKWRHLPLRHRRANRLGPRAAPRHIRSATSERSAQAGGNPGNTPGRIGSMSFVNVTRLGDASTGAPPCARAAYEVLSAAARKIPETHCRIRHPHTPRNSVTRRRVRLTIRTIQTRPRVESTLDFLLFCRRAGCPPHYEPANRGRSSVG